METGARVLPWISHVLRVTVLRTTERQQEIINFNYMFFLWGKFIAKRLVCDVAKRIPRSVEELSESSNIGSTHDDVA